MEDEINRPHQHKAVLFVGFVASAAGASLAVDITACSGYNHRVD